MPSADPMTETRRERFRAYCKRKNWFDEGRGTWLVTDIAAATFKPRNKVSDLLNGKGSFGAKIARELERNLELPAYYLEAVEFPEEQAEVVPKSSEKSPSPNNDVERYVGDVLGVIETYLEAVDEGGRDYVSLALANFARNPKGERERATGILASAMKGEPSPVDPTPTRATKKSKASTKPSAKPRLEIRAGGGQQTMFAVPVPPLRKIMRDEDAPSREQEWYESLPKPPKVNR